jgi:hypothetical protein
MGTLYPLLAQYQQGQSGDLFRIGQADILVVWRLQTNTVTLQEISTTERGHGHGSHALTVFCQILDMAQYTCFLRPKPFDFVHHVKTDQGWVEQVYEATLTTEQLIAWYGRYGFQGNKGGMWRQPKQEV